MIHWALSFYHNHHITYVFLIYFQNYNYPNIAKLGNKLLSKTFSAENDNNVVLFLHNNLLLISNGCLQICLPLMFEFL